MAEQRKRRVVRIVVSVLAVVLIGAVAVVGFLGPTIASAFAPGIIENVVAKNIRGDARVDRVRLSWSGPQEVRGLVVHDARGTEVLNITASADAGLVGLLRGNFDLGEVRVSGLVAIEGDSSTGEIRTAETLSRPDGGKGAPAAPTPSLPDAFSLPSSLRASLVVDGLTVRYTELATESEIGVVEFKGVRGGASLAMGAPMEASLVGGVDADGEEGTFEFDTRVTGWSEPDGSVTLGSAQLVGSLKADVPAAIAALAEEVAAFIEPSDGGRITLDASADGTMSLLALVATLDAPGLTFDGSAEMTGGDAPRLRSTGPITLRATVSQRTLDALGVDAEALTLEAPTEIGLDIDNLSAGLPRDGKLDLRGTRMEARLTSGEVRGTMRAPGEEAAKSFSARGLMATAKTADLADGLTLAASMDATYDGADAGTLRADMMASELLDAEGAPRSGTIPALEGVAEARGVSTAILQPFAAALDHRIDLMRDLGEIVSARIEASTSAGDDGGLASDIRISATSAGATLDGNVEVDNAGIRSANGLTLRLTRLGRTLSALLGGADVQIDPGREVVVRLSGLDAPVRDGAIDPAQATADLSVETGEMVFRFASTGEEITAMASALGRLRPGEAPSLQASIDGARRGEAFTMRGELAAPRAFDESAEGIGRAALRGTVTGARIPISLARAVGVAAEDVELARLAAGDTVDLRAELRPTNGAIVDALVTAQSALLEATADAAVRENEAELRSFVASWSPSESFVVAVQRRFAPEMNPVRVSASRLRATVEPLRVPLREGFAPDLAGAGVAVVRLTGDGPVEVRDAVELFGERRSAGLRDLRGVAEWDLGGEGTKRVELSGALFDPTSSGGQGIGALSVDADLAGAPPEARLLLDGASTRAIDSWLDQPGMLEWSLGDTARIAASVRPTGDEGAAETIARVDAPLVRTGVRALMAEDRFALLEPVEASWTMDPRWAARYVTPPGEDFDEPAFVFETPTEMTVRVDALTIARGEGPLKPGVFQASARATASNVRLLTREGERVDMRSLNGEARTEEDGRALAFRIGLGALQGRSGTGASGEAAVVEGIARGFADESGALRVADAQATVAADGEIPTALLDALAGSGGRLDGMLGPVVSAQIRANDFSRRGGTLDATARSDRASASVKGRVEDGVFVASEPTRAELREITEEFSVSALKGLTPVLGAIRKTESDKASSLSVEGLRFPLGIASEEARRAEAAGAARPALVDLSGRVRLDLGDVQYKLNQSLGAILRPDRYSQESYVTRELPAIEATIEKGVMRYGKTRIPLRDFEVETEGRVNLALNEMDATVWVPAFALVSDFLNLFGQKGLGEMLQGVPVLDQITDSTMMPIRMRGSVDSPRVEPDVERFVRELGPRAIERGVGDLLDKLIKPKKD